MKFTITLLNLTIQNYYELQYHDFPKTLPKFFFMQNAIIQFQTSFFFFMQHIPLEFSNIPCPTISDFKYDLKHINVFKNIPVLQCL